MSKLPSGMLTTALPNNLTVGDIVWFRVKTYNETNLPRQIMNTLNGYPKNLKIETRKARVKNSTTLEVIG